MPTLARRDDVFVLDLGDTENRFHPSWVEEVTALLDEVGAATEPRALVTTATGKFFSNGLDLEWLEDHQDQRADYLDSVEALYARILSLPVVTVAAVQGHAYAAGAMLTLAHDLRVMRADRGFWCLPEADIGIPFTDGMSSLVRERLDRQVAHRAMVTSERFGGVDAAASGVVDRAVDEQDVLPTAVDLAARQTGKAGDTLATIKARMYAPLLEVLHG